MSLAMGRCLHRNRWTELPMPQDAVDHVGTMGLRQKMPKTLTFTDRFGFELPDAEDDVDDEHAPTMNLTMRTTRTMAPPCHMEH
jgi:hypothetical protein